MHRLSRTCLLIAALLLSPAPVSAEEAKDVFEARTFTQGDAKLLYRIMKPDGYDAKQKYPLVIFLHGAGERGDDNLIQLVHGMNDFAKTENRRKYPCFVIAPQCPLEQKWVNVDWSSDAHKMPSEPSDSLKLTFSLIAALQKEFTIDKRRLYITGLSMGGYGTWDAISRQPSMFAAAVPVCGGGDEEQAAKLVKIPIWAFHGDQDTAVKPERSRRMIKAIEAAAGKPKYTEYPGVGHNSWVKAYSDPDMMAWLFSQKLPE